MPTELHDAIMDPDKLSESGSISGRSLNEVLADALYGETCAGSGLQDEHDQQNDATELKSLETSVLSTADRVDSFTLSEAGGHESPRGTRAASEDGKFSDRSSLATKRSTSTL